MTSKLEPRRRIVVPRDAHAEQVCSLDKETAARRSEPPDAFLASARSQETRENGATFRFAAEPGMWERMSAFVDEEGECCPFFGFEQLEEGDELVLRIMRPPAGDGRPAQGGE